MTQAFFSASRNPTRVVEYRTLDAVYGEIVRMHVRSAVHDILHHGLHVFHMLHGRTQQIESSRLWFHHYDNREISVEADEQTRFIVKVVTTLHS